MQIGANSSMGSFSKSNNENNGNLNRSHANSFLPRVSESNYVAIKKNQNKLEKHH